MKATREEFENFLTEIKKGILQDTKIGSAKHYDFKDYTEFLTELEEFLANNSTEKFEIWTSMGIGIDRV